MTFKGSKQTNKTGGTTLAWVWFNGKILPDNEAPLSPYDRGLTLADGVFETMRVHGAEPLWQADHLERLKLGCQCFGIPLTVGHEELASGVARLAELTRFPRSAVRLTVTRGPSSKRGLWPPSEPITPSLLLTIAELSIVPAQQLIVARITRRNEHSPLARIKSLAYGDNLLAKREAIERGATDALMLNSKGNVACATTGNIFLKIDGMWITPPLSDGVLPGLARARLIKLLGAVERSVVEASLQKVTAAFVSNSLACGAVVTIEGRELSAGVGEPDQSAIYG